MQRITRRLFAITVLPLLLWMLSGGAGSGGWYCADGSWCEPPLALTCCCGAPSSAPDDCNAADADRPGPSVCSLPCGCYYQAQSIDARQQAAGSISLDTAALHPAVPSALAPPDCTALLWLPADDRGPPGAFVSSPVIRGPPSS